MSIEPKTCPICCGWGYRGMDRCNWCDTTGSVFEINGKRFPNTEEGYNAATREGEAK